MPIGRQRKPPFCRLAGHREHLSAGDAELGEELSDLVRRVGSEPARLLREKEWSCTCMAKRFRFSEPAESAEFRARKQKAQQVRGQHI